MNKQEVTDLGFEIVAYSGEARSELLTALKKAKEGDFAGVDDLINQAQDCLNRPTRLRPSSSRVRLAARRTRSASS